MEKEADSRTTRSMSHSRRESDADHQQSLSRTYTHIYMRGRVMVRGGGGLHNCYYQKGNYVTYARAICITRRLMRPPSVYTRAVL